MNISTYVSSKTTTETWTSWYKSTFVGIITLLLCVSASQTLAQYKYVGVWDSGSGSNLITNPLSWKGFLKKGEGLTKKGLRLDDFEVIRKGVKTQYMGSWRNGSGNNIITKGLIWKAFLKKGEELTKKGYRLWDFEIINKFGKRLYVGNWRTGSGNNIITKGLIWKAFLKKGEELTKKGYRLWDFEIINKFGKRLYVGNWRTGSGNNIITKGLTWKAFLKKGEELTVKGYRLWDFEVYKIGRRYRYVGNWRSGSGSNIITKALSWNNFIKKGNILTKKGLRLYDVEIIKVRNFNKFIGAWRSGTGSNIIKKGLFWNDFLSEGKQLTSKGLRLTDFEPFFVKQTPLKPVPGTDPKISEFPKTPRYINLLDGTRGSDKYRVVVDFTKIIDNQPTITIPTQFLKTLPSYEGEVIFPNNFCGMRIIKASRFIWHDGFGNVFDDFPYNTVPENTTINKRFKHGEALYLGGIDFTGPVGKCVNSKGNWMFPFPYTQTQTVLPQPLKLVIELEADSEIKFLNFNIKPAKSLSAKKLFKDVDFKKLLKFYKKTFYDGFKQWVDVYCEESPKECPLHNEDK